ncbi:MAG: RNA polymerase sigma factor, partial [Pseudonocardia sp.]|nr:RNA polymerase sigma factor [Pseudonocardia sp.]
HPPRPPAPPPAAPASRSPSQDRSRWDAGRIAEGVALITAALPRGPVGAYQLQAAIAAVHDEAPDTASTDWPQIVALYGVLLQITDTPLVRLNHAVAVSMVDGPRAGLDLVDGLPLAGDHRLHAVRAHLLETAGDPDAARAAYLEAARLTTSLPQQRYLHARADRL